VLWTWGWYIGGGDSELNADFGKVIPADQIKVVLGEKAEAVEIWSKINDMMDTELAPKLSPT
jgi:hypothetical protein